jgi:D-2-hydroxyacid dehydrogenase (NADP+)
MRLRILVTLPLDAELRPRVAALVDRDCVRFTTEPTTGDLEWANVVVGNVPAATLLAVPDPPRWVHSPNVGLDAYDVVRDRRPDIRISHTTGILDAAVAEHAIALLLALTRNLPSVLGSQRDRAWGQAAYIAEARATTLEGKAAHVLGYGSIARALIHRLHGLGMHVTAYRREAKGDDALVERFARLDTLSALVGDADVVLCVLPSNEGTFHCIGARELAAMKPQAYLVNVGRGSTIDEAALVSSLQSGHPAGVALDVFEDEPLDPRSQLWAMAGVIVSPHVAGRSDLEMSEQVAGFVREFRKAYPSD